MYAQPDAQPRCLLDKYFDIFPADTHGLDVFYLRPKVSVTNRNVWYDCAPVGAHKLKTFLECMCKEAGVSQKNTNHSLRATGASALFNAGVPEKLIRGVTGHRSKALQLYERPTTEQLQETSAVLVQGKKLFCPGKENIATQGPSVATPALPMARGSRPGLFGSIFSGVTNITVNVSSTSKSSMDGLLDGLDLDEFTQF